MHRYIIWLLFAVIFKDGNAVTRGERNQLTQFIKHYEALNYDKKDLRSKHLRVRRSAGPHEELHLNFESHGSYFPLRLKRDLEIFAPSFQGAEGEHKFSPGNIYEGWIEGEIGSKVHGFIHNDIFEGKIYTSDGKQYHIEPAWKYFNNSKFHSIIYDLENVHYPYAHGASCGIKKGLKDWMRKIQTSAQGNKEESKEEQGIKDEHVKFVEAPEHPGHSRTRRAATPKTSCHLFVQSDWKFTETFAGGTTRALHLMTQYVKSVAHIYKQTKFTGYSHNVTLKISRMRANTSACTGACPFKDPNIGVAKFLELNSEVDHNAHCLAYIFTHRDFADGVLGLAWIGDTSGASGGVCERWKPYAGGKYKSLNTGVVSTLNYGQGVPTKVTEITLAHEIGHNFGAQHDPAKYSKTCSPGAKGGGNYIMYPRATSGSDTNNYKFSSCSRNYIGPVLVAKSNICFKVPEGPICGNKIVEGQEKCDCGYVEECNDPCCQPAGKAGATGCTYTTKAMAINETVRCSPSNGFCCDNKTCAVTKQKNLVCSAATECAEKAFCDGKKASCPTAIAKPNIVTNCSNDRKVCINGTCTGSICLQKGKIDCMCANSAHFCHICCQNKNDSNSCKATNLKQSPGSPCDNYKGYCDVLYKCRKVDAEGPLSRLKNFIFNKKTFNSIYTWMQEKWWACVLIGLGLVLFMAGFIKLCSVHTPSSNPNLPQARPMTLPRTMSRKRRPIQTNPSAPPIAPSEERLPGYDTAMRQPHPSGGRRGQAHHGDVHMYDRY